MFLPLFTFRTRDHVIADARANRFGWETITVRPLYWAQRDCRWIEARDPRLQSVIFGNKAAPKGSHRVCHGLSNMHAGDGPLRRRRQDQQSRPRRLGTYTKRNWLLILFTVSWYRREGRLRNLGTAGDCYEKVLFFFSSRTHKVLRTAVNIS